MFTFLLETAWSAHSCSFFITVSNVYLMCHFVACAAHCAKCETNNAGKCDSDGCDPDGYHYNGGTMMCDGESVDGYVIVLCHVNSRKVFSLFYSVVCFGIIVHKQETS